MREAFLAHRDFKDEWKNWRTGKLKSRQKEKGNKEPRSVSVARKVFWEKTDRLFDAVNILELKFTENQGLAIDELTEFLEIDIPAFRCGYAKEIFLEKLKNIELTESEKKKVRRTAIAVCANGNIRREYRRWCRLMIKLADADFIPDIRHNLESEEVFVRLKAKWMIELIQKHRPDLRDQAKN